MFLWVAWSGVGRAQDVPAPEAPAPEEESYNYDRLLVTTVQPDDRAWAPDAEALFQAMVDRLQKSNAVVKMSEVPTFDVQGYDAATYMLGCPPGQYSGCELVVGQRAEADRAVGATVRRDPDEVEDGKTVLVATFHIVDVASAREVVSFSVPVHDGETGKVVDGLAVLYDEVVRGEYELRDLRDREDPDQDQLDAARRERMAAALEELEHHLGSAVVSGDVGVLHAPKVTRADLAEYAERDDTPPWEQLRMSEGEYLRFANSGETYPEWQRSGWGRTARLLLRIGGGFGSGPFSERYAAQVLLSDTTLQPVDRAQLLEVTQGPAPVGDFEVGVGVLPWLEVSFAAAVHAGKTTSESDEDVQDQVPLPSRATTTATSTWQYGARAAVAPFPRWPARPVVQAGFAAWKGAGIAASDRFDRLEAPDATFLELMPGVEVSANDAVVPWARLVASIPLGGTLLREEPSAGIMTNAPVATGDPGVGVAVQAGIQVRVGPFVKPRTTTAGPTFDEP